MHLEWTPSSISVEMFLRDIIKKYDRHPGWTDGADWYSLACQSMNLKHHVYQRGFWLWKVTERAVRRLKERTKSFDDLFPCSNHGMKCRLKHIWNWVSVFWLHCQPEYQSFKDQIKLSLSRKVNGAVFRNCSFISNFTYHPPIKKLTPKEIAEIARRTKFYNGKEAAKFLSTSGVPRNKQAMKALISTDVAGTGKDSQESLDCLSFVSFIVHPQQINVRDKANGKIIAVIPK